MNVIICRADRTTPFLQTGFTDDRIRIFSDGRVSVSHFGVLGIVCPLNPQTFPFDGQDCAGVLQIYTYTAKEVTMEFSSAKYAGDQSSDHPVWEANRVQLKTVRRLSNTQQNYYDSAIIIFSMKRKSLYYTCTMTVPSMLLSILTLGAFFIPNDSGEKISCGLAIFLSFMVFLLQIGDIVPENSNGISVMGMSFWIFDKVVQVYNNKKKSFDVE